MTPRLLAPGPPPLTEEAADAALDAIDFIAAAVRGIDTIDVTPKMRALWRQHIAASFGYLPPWTRAWFANAPFLMTTLQTQWPLLNPVQQEALRQGWMVELPAMLQMLEPVLQQTDEQLNPALQTDIDAMRDLSAVDPNLAAFQHGMHSATLQAGSTTMTTATIDLMHALNRSS
jgi:hypothetical protein